MEALAAVLILREAFPSLRQRVINVVDLMALQAPSQHPHGVADDLFDRMPTTDKPAISAYHGYPSHPQTYRRAGGAIGDRQLHVVPSGPDHAR
jgi:xylulose-5-phosphate/fructose-6-phosphate phosphoketolase